MSIAHVIGIDPGLVDTGVVSLTFRPRLHILVVEHGVVDGTNADLVKEWVLDPKRTPATHIFIEAYRPRQNLGSDVRMVQAEQDLKRALPTAKILPNTGVKRVIPQQLMEVCGVWSWPTATHHQDLRSAARIALLGMVKDHRLNTVLADMVRDRLEGNAWNVAHV